MLFSSIVFIFYFLPAFLILYYLTGIRNSVLLTGSAIFYVWGEGIYLLLLASLLVINFIVGIRIGAADEKNRKVWLTVGICINIAALAIFKYSQFILDTAGYFADSPPPQLNIHLPLGISFFIFQLISYLIEVHRKTIIPETMLTRLSTYVMMFPHLVAGPIVRYTDIQKELSIRSVSITKIGLGIQFFIIGLCQKVLIANSVAPAADHLFNLDLSTISLGIAWIGTLAYTLQIYFDFCGYSNMAIGLAFMLGFTFPKNFDYPYSSKSITEFWRRWHMSLSFWFRDYIYIPLGGSHGGKLLTIRNLLIVFFVTGLWHGAAWTFVFWGIFHGFFVVMERLVLKKWLESSPAIVARLYTLIIVMIGWIFFRADNFNTASSITKALVGIGTVAFDWNSFSIWVSPETLVALTIGSILSFPVIPALLEKLAVQKVRGTPEPGMHGRDSVNVHILPSPVLVMGFITSLLFLASSTLNPFLYFRF